MWRLTEGELAGQLLGRSFGAWAGWALHSTSDSGSGAFFPFALVDIVMFIALRALEFVCLVLASGWVTLVLKGYVGLSVGRRAG